MTEETPRRDRKQPASDLCEAFGVAIAELRNSQNMSQEDFAHHCKINRTHMTSIEKGRISVGLDIINRLAKGLNMTITDLMLIAEKKQYRR
jgi:transcriptional regulator with XRE-family HTH domain